MNLQSLIAKLDQDFDTVANASLADCAIELADSVRSALSTLPGGPHDHPWLRSGELRDSIEASSDGPNAVVASTSEVAAYQEHGNAALPPRPTFAPVAAIHGNAIANSIANAVTQALRSL